MAFKKGHVVSKKTKLKLSKATTKVMSSNEYRKKLGKARHLAYGNHCNLSQKAIEWINGELLGDGSLYSRSSYSARFTYGSKHEEYINYVCDILNFFGIEQAGKINEYYDKRWGNKTYCYRSREYAELLPIYKQWYPKGKKIVPKDLELTPLTIRQWYIGDGSLSHPKKGKPSIILATCGFLVSNVNFLIQKLKKLGFVVTRRKSNNIIGFSTCSTKDFLNYIGKCPMSCYDYKFNYKVS